MSYTVLNWRLVAVKGKGKNSESVSPYERYNRIQERIIRQRETTEKEKGGWKQSNSKNYKKNYDLNSNLIQLIPTSQNRFEVLSNLKEDNSLGALSKDDKIQFLNTGSQVKGINQLARSVKTSDHKVLLIGDSHAKKCATELRHKLDHNYEVCWFY
jgi:hypothetical protein